MQTRRDFLCTTLNSTAAILAASAFPTSLFAQQKPNVLFIVVDDLNDWIGCLGGHPGFCNAKFGSSGELEVRYLPMRIATRLRAIPRVEAW